MNSDLPRLTPSQQRLVIRTLDWLKERGAKPGSMDQFIKDVDYVRSLWRKLGISESTVKAMIP